MSSNVDAQLLHKALLRPAILHILRAQGFHSARPSVVEALTDIASRYILLLAQTTASYASVSRNDLVPEITDIRMALQDCGMLLPTMTAAEEAWKQALRKPLDQYPERMGIRLREKQRRETEDTRDVKEFIDWVRGPVNKEIARVAGLAAAAGDATKPGETNLDDVEREDYLSMLKKKHSRTGEEARFQGTVLGKEMETRIVKIEGGPAESLQDWLKMTRDKNGGKRDVESSLSTVEGDTMVVESTEK